MFDRDPKVVIDRGVGARERGREAERVGEYREQESDVRSMMARAKTTCAVKE
jgi:hypothetical protein